jgi:Fe-S-cluster containining protein
MDRSALLEGLWAKIDAFVAKVDQRHPGELACRAGCSDCCLGGLSVTEVEAEAIARLLATSTDEERAALALRADAPNDERCVALDQDGRCGIYAARPVVCRSHGVPIRFREALAEADPPEANVRRLPMIDVCPKNFETTPLDTIAADCVLDQTTLSTALAAIDAMGRPASEKAERIELAALLTV